MQRIAWGLTGAIFVLAVGMTLAPHHHHVAQATSSSTFQAQKQALLTQSINQALHHTEKAVDVGITHWKAPSPQPIPWPTVPMALVTPMIGNNAWLAGLYPGTMDEVWVMAGASKTNPNIGILNVLVVDTMSPAPWTGEFLTPQATGTLSITDIHGETVTWTSTSGLNGTFNLSTHVWSIS
jgi:hypothetical protein